MVKLVLRIDSQLSFIPKQKSLQLISFPSVHLRHVGSSGNDFRFLKAFPVTTIICLSSCRLQIAFCNTKHALHEQKISQKYYFSSLIRYSYMVSLSSH